MSDTLRINTVRQQSLHLFNINIFSSIQTLTTLDLSHNQIQPQGAQYLSDALRINKVR